MSQIELHKKIDDLIQVGIATITIVDLEQIINTNIDARRYFFTKIGESWFNWLLTNNFFEVIKQPSDNLTQIIYKTPELDYLVKIAEKEPKKVTDFILSFNVASNLNLETIDRFLWIATKLPVNQLIRIVPKIHDENWVRILKDFEHWGFKYKQMIDTLATSKSHESIILLAKSILAIRTKEEIVGTRREWMSENPFYLSDLYYTEIFQRLTEVDDTNKEAAAGLILKTLNDIVVLNAEKEDDIFQYGDTFSLFDVDFFTLTLENEKHHSYRDDVRDLAATAKILISKLIKESCDKTHEVTRIYKTYIDPLPNSRTIWRFKLYIWSLCPNIFKNELRAAIFQGIES